jgi:murein DD-endopeptidase MepM/ murein hydrolase activator NlpD
MKGSTMRRTIVFFFFLSFVQPLFAQQQGNERFVTIINRLVEAMNNQDYQAIVREYDKELSVNFPLFKTSYFFKNNFETFGKVLKVNPPQVKAIDQALCVMYSERGVQDLMLYLDDAGKIKGFLFTTHVTSDVQPNSTTTTEPAPVAAPNSNPPSTKPAAQLSSADSSLNSTSPREAAPGSTPPASPMKQPAAPIVRDKQQTELFLPFAGAWLVTASGDIREGASTQRNLLQQQYTYEFSGTDAAGMVSKNTGKLNEDYFGYGRDIFAPANGTIIEAIDGIRENSPGTRNPYAQIGNAIIIQHSNKEYSVFAFLKQGSIRVKAGDRVSRGQVIAQCGNSGNTTEPVVHYHLQNSPSLQTAGIVKFYFERVMVTKEGKKQLQSNYLPVIGDVVSPE